MEFLSTYNVTLVVAGLGVLALSTLLHRFDGRPFSFPILAVALGAAVFSLPLGLPLPDPHAHGRLALHLTELGVILSLMGVGLKLDRFPAWKSWSATWRLLAISMPLTIAGVALLGWWMLALTPAAAVLLGSVLSPTDPVLASDVQVGEPDDPCADEEEKEDEVRFALTSEAGLNDSLAFPFTWIALLMASEGAAPGNWWVRWLMIDVLYRLAVGVIIGLAVGWLLARVLLRIPTDSESDRTRAGVGALAATLLLYGLTECAGGYGFLATFIGSLTIRHVERAQATLHRSFHAFAEQSEQLLMTVILIALGGAVAHGLLAPLTWSAALLAVLLVFVVRPAAGWLGLLGCERLSARDRVIVCFFGIRGIGSFFYLSYALQKGEFAGEELLWAVCSFTVLLSVGVHGVAAAPVMRAREHARRRLAGSPDRV